MQYQGRRLVWVGAVVFAAAILIVLALVLRQPTKKPASAAGTNYVDKFSHETVSNPAGKAPDTNGTNPNLPVYLGFSKLFDYGLNENQIQVVGNSFYNYSKTLKNPIKQVSVDVDHINTYHDSTTPNAPFIVKFKVMFNEQNVYQVTVQYTDFNNAELVITTLGGQQVYDSGYVTYIRQN